MGHSIDAGFLKSTDKESAMKEGLSRAIDFAYYNGDREEGSDNYSSSFKYYNKEFDNEDEAMEFFFSLGAYNDGVVKVKMPTKASKTRYENKVRKYEEKINQIKMKRIEDFKNRKSKTVGCKKCGTRITSEIALKNNLICPSCRHPFGGDTYINRIKAYNNKIEEAEQQYRNDQRDTGKLRYWYKCEVHC